MQKIIPAVLSDQLEEYRDAISLFESFEGNDKIHIDIMDGEFVDTISADLSDILKIPTKLKRQVHLMEKDPLGSLELCLDHKVEEVAIHYQSDYRDYQSLSELRESGMEVYLAINPEVDLIDIPILNDILKSFDGILIMTVHPGKQGGEFLPEELNEIMELKKVGFNGKIIEDGHVNLDTIDQVKDLDIDEFVVGSGVIKQENPAKAYYELCEKFSN